MNNLKIEQINYLIDWCGNESKKIFEFIESGKKPYSTLEQLQTRANKYIEMKEILLIVKNEIKEVV